MTLLQPLPIDARKGARTRRQILAGALRVLAARGLEGTTHRAVAKAAGVSLSTTTYHFTSLEEMLIQAFDLILAEGNEAVHRTLAAAHDRVTASGLAPDSPAEIRCALRGELTALLVDYLHDPSPDRKVQQAAEMRFFYETGHIAELQERLDLYRAAVVARMRLLPELAGSDEPDIDAAILFDAIQTMQFRALFRPDEATRPALAARARRHIGWILGC